MKLCIEVEFFHRSTFCESEKRGYTNTIPPGLPKYITEWVVQGILFEEGYNPDTVDWSWWLEDDEPSEHSRETLPAPEASS